MGTNSKKKRKNRLQLIITRCRTRRRRYQLWFDYCIYVYVFFPDVFRATTTMMTARWPVPFTTGARDPSLGLRLPRFRTRSRPDACGRVRANTTHNIIYTYICTCVHYAYTQLNVLHTTRYTNIPTYPRVYIRNAFYEICKKILKIIFFNLLGEGEIKINLNKSDDGLSISKQKPFWRIDFANIITAIAGNIGVPIYIYLYQRFSNFLGQTPPTLVNSKREPSS